MFLTPVLGGPGAPRYPVSEALQIIGRSEKADITLLEPTISRRHASVQLRDQYAVLTDLGSKHGTFVNSKRVEMIRLRLGDIVVFGLSLVLRLEASDTPVQASEDGLITEVPTATDVTNLRAEDAVPGTQAEWGDAMNRETGVVPLDDTRSPQQIMEVGMLCASHLPPAHERLVDLRDELRRLVNDGVDETDPYPVLARVESVLGNISRIVAVLYGDAERGL